MSSIPPRIATPDCTLTDNESNSSYCLLTDGDLHFLPYELGNANSKNHSNASTNGRSSPRPVPNIGNLGHDYPIYSSFLNNKTVSSFDSPNPSSTHLSSMATNSNVTDHISIQNADNNKHFDTIHKLLDNYKSHAIYLPNDFIPLVDNAAQNDKIKSLLLNIFTHWTATDKVSIKKLTGGITNMLLKCCYNNPNTDMAETVLVRTYGNGTDLIIDRDREFVSHLVLNSLNLAPPIHARFGNGLVYGFIEGSSLEYDQLSNNTIYPLIASKLACLHKITDVNKIDESLNKLRHKFNCEAGEASQDDIWSVLLDWIEKLPMIKPMLDLCLRNMDIATEQSAMELKAILYNEVRWLQNEIGSTSINVISHNDLLSGNIIIPEIAASAREYEKYEKNPVSFIDYEYMMPAPRAFDIANHFMEWQGFDCDKSRIPQFTYNKASRSYENPIVWNWCENYLNSFHSSDPTLNPYSKHFTSGNVKEVSIQHLVNEVAYHYGMPGLYWGIWACIQSEISYIDFDYASYSCERLIEYWNWKRAYLLNKAQNSATI